MRQWSPARPRDVSVRNAGLLFWHNGDHSDPIRKKSRQSTSWDDARRRVVAAYREWIRAAPEIQTMYSVPFPVSVIRTRMRQEFERHRYVNKLPVVDVLLFKSHADYQETMNFWRQTTHIMSYFNEESFRGDKRLPSSFLSGFLEGRN